MARLGQSDEAFQRLEENLGRGLLDELAAREDKSLTKAESARLTKLVAELDRLDHLFEAPIARPKNSAEQTAIEDLRRQRERAQFALGALCAELAAKHGPIGGKVAALSEIQSAFRRTRRLLPGSIGLRLVPRPRIPAVSIGAWSCGGAANQPGFACRVPGQSHLERRRFQTGRRGPQCDHSAAAAEHSYAKFDRKTSRAALGSAHSRAGSNRRWARRRAAADRPTFPGHGRCPDRAAACTQRPVDCVVCPIRYRAGLPAASASR